ncbi:helix-turn-helix transcriptional regulator [Paenibacillus dakarensis]|uniref:helix-turn-helix transcriptional regulator n=1 Tax=Paenibacillus dakarensis TaxID=1527293 RepID=UPI0006D59FEF|nr:helix-turn-helix transcriptional regulator [Paenibacillus dakarensis]
MLNNIVRKLRKERGMSVAELARRSNTSRQTITNIELKGQEPSGYLLISISEALERDPRDIFFKTSVTHVKQKEKSA